MPNSTLNADSQFTDTRVRPAIPIMLHDSLSPEADPRLTGDDRRLSARRTVHAELVVRWHHDHATPVRYPVLDMGEGGCRIHSATPLLRGMSGTAVRLLPEGAVINRMCTVTWSRARGDGRATEVGLRFG